MNHPLPDPPEICALEFKGKFRRFGICTVSATIGIDRLVFWRRLPSLERAAVRKKTVTTLSRLMSLQQRSAIARRGDDGRQR
jgi:hypothetical protein